MLNKVIHIPDNNASTNTTSTLPTEEKVLLQENNKLLSNLCALLNQILNHQRLITGVEAETGEEF